MRGVNIADFNNIDDISNGTWKNEKKGKQI